MISKATGVYVIMLAVFGAGLWAILSFGSIILQAPTDLAGQWELRRPGAGEQTEKPDHVMTIEQSGRYVRISLDNANPVSMKLSQAQTQTAGAGPDLVQLKLASDDQTAIILDGRNDADEYKAKLLGLNVQGEWLATRVVRTYPKHKADQPATRSTAQPTTAHARL